MPQNLTIPFHAFKLHLQNGEEVTVPLSDSNALHLKKPISQLAKKYQERFQEKLLNKGKYSQILDEIQQGDFLHKMIQVEFPAAKDGISYPAFELDFDCFYQWSEGACWGLVPALGLESMAEGEEELEANLKEVIKVDFTSKKRLSAVQLIVSSLWFEVVSIEKEEMEFKFSSPAELLELQKEEQQKLLPNVAAKLNVRNQVAYGRTEELKQMERILDSPFSKNILLVGASGTGKTALVWELARRRLKQKPQNFIWETTASVLIKELTMDTGWQDNLSLLVNELTLNGDFLFVRNLSELFEVGRYAGNEVSMADYLRSYISRGELTIITECTPEERARIELQSPNYLSFFQMVRLEEPKADLEDIILLKVEDIAGRKKVIIENEAIKEVIRLHRRFSPYSGMPGKPIRFLESILFSESLAPNAKKKKGKKEERSRIQTKTSETVATKIDRKSVLAYYCDESGLPLFMVDPDLPMDVEAIKEKFNKNVFGQKKAVHAVVDLLASVKTALTRSGKPIASFLFVGPTGVGKTELAKVLATFMFGSRDRLLRFDMSEFSDPYSVGRLTGQGFGSDGLLTSAVRREPFCVLLFDEIEKADPAFYDLLLQILGEGRLSDSQGKLVNFCSAIIIMTSNIGASKLQYNRIGWKKDLDVREVTNHFEKEVEKKFKPELFNRIDSIVAFEPLSKEIVRLVVEREFDLFKKREGIQFRSLEIDLEESVMDFLAVKGYDPRYGARYLQRMIREELIIPMAYTLNQFEFDDQLILKVVLEDGKIKLETSSDPLAFELLMEQWDKLTLADQTSFLRRKMMMMQESNFFMRVQSEIAMMGEEKNLNETSFWADLEQSDYYNRLLEANAKAETLYTKIKQYEIDIALASMGQGPFDVGLEERLETWEDSFFRLQVQILALLQPENNTCSVAIYGANPEPILKFYQQVIALKTLDIKLVQAIWYREGFMGIDDDNPYLEEEKKEPGPYVKRVINGEELSVIDIQTPRTGDRLYGIEMSLVGKAVFLYFEPENGLQHWETNNKDSLSAYQISFLETGMPTPSNIHRQQFYQKLKPRRIVRESLFIDHLLGIQLEMKQKDLSGFLVELLDEQFKKTVEALFV